MPRRRRGEEARERTVERRVRKTLYELGFEDADWSEDAFIEFYPGRSGEADFFVKIGDQPLIVIEAEPDEAHFEGGYLQARAYAILFDPENPVPYIWVAAGRKDGLFRATPPPSGVGVRYERVERLLSRDEILDALKFRPETFQRDLDLYERLVSVFEKALRILQEQRRPRLEGETLLRAWAAYLRARVEGDSKALKAYQLTRTIIRRLDEHLEQLGELSKYEGWILAYAFRQTVRPFFRGGEYGRYFTPPEVIQLLVSAVNPRPGESVLDFACGSGGFLGQTARHLLERYQAKPEDIADNLFGCDWDETCVETAKTFLALMLPGKQKKLNIERADGLRHFEDNMGGFDVVLSNPPARRLSEDFAGLEEIEHYRFAGRGRGRYNQYEVAFLERSLQMARDGGRIGLVIPEGLLANATLREMRDWWFARTTIELIVSLPRGIFPFTPSKMCAVVMRKVPPPEKHEILLVEVETRNNLTDEDILRKFQSIHGTERVGRRRK